MHVSRLFREQNGLAVYMELCVLKGFACFAAIMVKTCNTIPQGMSGVIFKVFPYSQGMSGVIFRLFLYSQTGILVGVCPQEQEGP